MLSDVPAKALTTLGCCEREAVRTTVLDAPSIPYVFSPSVFGPALARALDGLLALQAHDAQLYASSPIETVALCGSLCLQPPGNDFYAADQLSRHYYSAGVLPVAFDQVPGLKEAMGGLNMLEIRRMLRAMCEARRALAEAVVMA
jgi:hypothetical protein